MLAEILENRELQKKPPVLVDVGASGELSGDWKILSKYAICLAFDADKRETAYLENEKGNFRKLLRYNSIVSHHEGLSSFYLTRSPFCSSVLQPRERELEKWAFSDLFKIEKELSMPMTTLNTVLKKANLDYIDWIKIDSQGVDLRIFKSISESVRKKVLVAEFEPGIMDAYEGEDKLHSIINYMSQRPFFCDSMVIRGNQRINRTNIEKYFSPLEKRFFFRLLKSSACWAEISFLNSLENISDFNKRDLLLASIFGFVKKQYGYVIEVAEKAKQYYEDEIFEHIKMEAIKRIKRNKYKIFPYLFRRIMSKMLHT